MTHTVAELIERRLTESTIWNEEQNKPSLVVDDLRAYAPEHVIYHSLLRRGVFKWLAVRRDLIKLKNTWRDKVRDSLARQRHLNGPDVNYERGYRRAIEECRAEIRALCHSERWRAPDCDSKATQWLQSLNAPSGSRERDAI